MTGKLLVPNFNIFKVLGMKLEKAVGTKDVVTVLKAICEVLYISSLQLVCMKGAKLLTDADGNRIINNADLDGVYWLAWTIMWQVVLVWLMVR